MVEDNIIKEKLYEYEGEDGRRMGIVQGVSEAIRGKKYVMLDNGDQIEMTSFLNTASYVNESEDFIDMPKSYGVEADMSNIQFPQAKLDADGFPIMQLEQSGINNEDFSDMEGMENVVSPESYFAGNKPSKIIPKNDNPIASLLDKAKKDKISISITLDFDGIDKNLFDVIKNSFGEETEDNIFDYIVNNIDNTEVYVQITKKIKEYYGK